MKKLLAVAALTIVCTTAAYANTWWILDTHTNQCKISENSPNEIASAFWDAPITTRRDATGAIAAMVHTNPGRVIVLFSSYDFCAGYKYQVDNDPQTVRNGELD